MKPRSTVQMQAHYVAEGFTKPEALAAMAAAPDASIRVCDKAWKVSAESQATMRKFLERYRELGGVFEEAPAAPAPAVDAEAKPANEPAAAEPPMSATPPAPAPGAPAKSPAAPAKTPAPAAPTKPSAAPAPVAPAK